MAAFNFPDPTIQQTVTNPITGSTYQWKEPPGKWVITTKVRAVSDIIYEGDTPPIPRGDYKLWYSTDTLELYFWYEDVNGNGAWVPTAAPITMLEDLDSAVFELRRDLTATNVAVKENENQIGRTIYFGDTAPTIYPDEVIDGATYRNELNYKFWYDDSRFELLILFRDANGNDSYVPVSTSPKGEVLKYTVDNNIGTLVTTPGKISSNSGFWSSVNKFSFGTEDVDGITTPTMSDGQTIETYSPEENKTNLYKITNASGAPTEVEVNYISGDLFYVPDLELDVYIRDELVDYVKKTGGDTMEGPLSISGPRKAGDDANNPDLVSSLEVLSIDNAQNSGLHLRHSGTTKLYVGADDLAVAADIKFNRGAGTVIKTNQQDIFNIGLNEVAYLGETIEEEDLVTKKYVDDADEVLRQDIIELEEEIDALAPAVDRGVWTFNLGGFASNQGQMSMYDDDYSGVGTPTPFFKSAKSIWLNQADNAGTIHGFGNVKQGNLIELFVEGEADYGLFEVIALPHDESGGAASWWVIEVQYLRALSETSSAEPLDNIRIKIFEAPSGGDASEFVRKSGDNMEGQLSMQGESGRNKIIGLASPTSDYHAANKTYVDDKITEVDDKITELLAKIEELEMASGTMETYQFQMNNNTAGGSSAIGSQIFTNQIMSCDNDGDNWNGQNTHYLSSEYRYIYVCFEDGYQLNSTGQMSVVRYSNSNQYDIRNSNVGTFNISGVEVCPPDKSSGKNIYRAVIQLDAYKPGTDAFYPSWGQGNVYVTFSGGSLTKVS